MSAQQDGPLGDLLEELRTQTGIPGLSVTVIVSGQRRTAAVGSLAAGTDKPLLPESRQLGCIANVPTSLVVLGLANDGALDLEAPLGEYLSEFGKLPRAREIRLRHLASHSSGYQGLNGAVPQVAYFYSRQKLVEFL